MHKHDKWKELWLNIARIYSFLMKLFATPVLKHENLGLNSSVYKLTSYFPIYDPSSLLIMTITIVFPIKKNKHYIA